MARVLFARAARAQIAGLDIRLAEAVLDSVTLLESEIPAHSHGLVASQGDGTERGPSQQLFATGIAISMYQAPGALVALNANAIAPAGGDQPHNNLMPYLTLNFCIALQGVFPPRT